MNVDMKGKASAEGVHDHHEAWEIILFVGVGQRIPLGKRLIHNTVEAIKVSASANAEVVEELMRGSKDHMLVLAVGKKRGVARNPDIRLFDPAT